MALTGLPYFGRLLGDPQTTALIDGAAYLRAMLAFEQALAVAEAEAGLIPAEAAEAIAKKVAGFRPDESRLAEATLRDGVPVPDLVAQLRAALSPDTAPHLHFGATSQDAIDTALALNLGSVFDLFDERLRHVVALLDGLCARFGHAPLMGRSRMQAAIEITAGDRIAVWRRSVEGLLTVLPEIRRANAILTLAGAAGTAEIIGSSAESVRARMAEILGLAVPHYVPHTDRSRIADLANWLSRVTGALGKIGQDCALMAQNGIGEITIAGGGGSSAMPHKQNPVRAEVLVALARYNATQLSALHHALVHEQERSGSAWTLEWLALPGMVESTGTALLHAISMLGDVTAIGTPDPVGGR